MSRSRMVPLIVSAGSIAIGIASGCMVSTDEDDVSKIHSVGVAPAATTADIDPRPPPTTNGLAPLCLFQTGVLNTLTGLANGAIATSTGTMPTMPSLPAPGALGNCRYILLRDLVKCALSPSQTIYDPADGTAYAGSFGLASSWRMGAMSSTQRRWVTGCLFQHLNGLGVEVSIVLEGNFATITPYAPYEAVYTLEDSSIWGNVFNYTGGAVAVNVCTHPSLLSCRDWNGGLNKRICDSEPNCNMVLKGSCSNVCTQSSAGVWTCPGFGYNEVVTSRVQAVDAGYVCGGM